MGGLFRADEPFALVVGCGDMGLGSARALGRRHPLLLVDIDQARLDQSVAALAHEGYAVSGHRCDISDRSQVAGLGDAIAARPGPGIRVLAHVAAIGNDGSGWKKVIEVDLVAASLVAEMVEPHLVPGGAAIFISSTGAQRCPADKRLLALLADPLRRDLCERLHELAGRDFNFLDAYFMAKKGVNMLAERLALQWGARGVRALSVSPGLIDSKMGRTGGSQIPIYAGDGTARLGTRDEKAHVEVPLRRQGSVLEVVAAVDFLASDAAGFISGIDVPVDGGSTAFWRLSETPINPLGEEQLAPSAPLAG